MKIVVGGCGWLGQKLGRRLIESGHEVVGTYRRNAVRSELEEIGIKGYCYNFLTEFTQISTEITDKADFVLLALPPINRQNLTDYSISLTNFLSQFDEKAKVFFVSSIGVYPNRTGEFDEEYEFTEEEQLNSLYMAESALRNIAGERLVILRLGGLIGEDRHPVRSLSGKTIESSGAAPLSLIHESDIARFIEIQMEKFTPGTYNLVTPTHYQKKAYYDEAAQALNFLSPNYIGHTDVERKIRADKVIEKLGFKYEFQLDNWRKFKL